ncbi:MULTISPECIES: type IV pilus twitching motility protein PilT [unclassified Lentimonas]|uniref:type IV pilus twitching motility protein PilT n=1 Tax=unclassified Lentimonas TaxID=2630993 RepID=UPI001328E126|nr:MULTISPECIES: PilT/PilU family type 4a pilus ATPase [unclassified Lentimonas]CAA6676867.1 Twitching motility protein PilT [Lentimonas sp. CC4]CAA6686674.1 Twitching motility protein PilT [Lentimonas sp. CC6]CAA7075749.1 Twitching motility protein PilT [Lentimonas sp. CC4]CAA7168092.1 Twitching motility protein PilT [Lentimonas sp. CC21]CAA7181760.1 Twitching motility protein PilT [Lentimonas sp. CC8]
MSVLETIHGLLSLAVENGASDVHIKSNKPAFLRLSGRLELVEMDPIAPDEVREFIEQTVPAEFYDIWVKNRQVDYSYNSPNVGRFRVNGFLQRGLPSIVMRHVSDHPPTFGALNLDGTTLAQLCSAKNGIVLLCGATGSGKSSTLAAMLNHINHSYDRHIVTLEDPIEYTYTDVKSIINQREIGIDCPSFAQGMRSVLRQDPDVILIGEMRDRDTFETALQASETGHLVFATLHASNAQQAVQRLFEFFPEERRVSLQRQLSGVLLATITQKLLPALEGGGRMPVSEAFVLDALARKTIQDGQFEKIEAVIEASEDNGSKTFNQDLFRLVKGGLISKDDAINNSPNPRQLEMNLKGIFLSSGGIVE